MGNLTFESFTKKIYLKSSLKKLYWCWATKEGICTWFLSSAQYATKEGEIRKMDEPVQEGDNYVWEWHNWNGQEKGQILFANGVDHLEFSFAGSCKVSIKLKEVNSFILLTLNQYDIPTDEKSKMNIYNGCSNGWTFWMANLKAYVEHGILLNETENDLTNEPLAGHIFVNM
ncbi:SRPBCC domain-containing protein [Euzebyella marina]|uniref:SRPBCC domain-containing protein n=1 Tax=Euzebyella marina TaxID=1761453 RepID=A0A3G2L8Q1_9FLAO|nr:SRPBCC domain-containing protein [Euzebyella marina]AYN68658.1 SRPBCC domain-containing protein [Euzebyella marina]